MSQVNHVFIFDASLSEYINCSEELVKLVTSAVFFQFIDQHLDGISPLYILPKPDHEDVTSLLPGLLCLFCHDYCQYFDSQIAVL